MDYTPEELAELTAEEREAIMIQLNEGQEVNDDDEKSLDAGDDAKAGETDEEKAARQQAEADAAAAAAAEAAKAAAPADDVPLLKIEDDADSATKLDEIKTAKSTLVQKFDDGEISAAEYQTQLDALNEQREAIVQAQFKNQIAAEMRQQQEVKAWNDTVANFLAQHPEYQAVEGKANVRHRALDNLVREIATANPNLPGAEILNRAHQQIIEDLGAPASAAAKPAAEKPAAAAKPEIPPTLGKIPAAEPNDVENTKFAKLDSLINKGDPEGYERALASLSDADRDAYLRSR